ncbi:hypothetical protein ACQP1G_17175 [Nocardia sp. CA-107356]|uniref:hypothetical protein n=1 Tax=Nocardia sp. CA-107356 TaxID=3239972 RepID=UPI003D8FD968
MVGSVEVHTGLIAAYGSTHAAMAANVAGAAGTNAAAAVASAVPVFGLIGQDFLTAFIFALGNNLWSSAEIAAVHAGTAAISAQGAAAYEGGEAASAVSFSFRK